MNQWVMMFPWPAGRVLQLTGAGGVVRYCRREVAALYGSLKAAEMSCADAYVKM